MKTENVSISIAATGDLVAGTPNTIIRVIHYTIVSAGAVGISFRSGAATQLTGTMSLVANQGLCVNVPPVFPQDVCLFQTAVGEALTMNMSGAIQVSGHMIIERIKVNG